MTAEKLGGDIDMGYTTDFEGVFTLDKPLTLEHQRYLKLFSETRRMQRDPVKAAMLCDLARTAAGLALGDEGGYFVGGAGFAGQDHDVSILNHNTPPVGQPGLWCKWQPTKDGTGIEWSGAEKFYEYGPWLQYLVQHFLKPWGYTLSGEVKWQGEDEEDTGTIVVLNNDVMLRPTQK